MSPDIVSEMSSVVAYVSCYCSVNISADIDVLVVQETFSCFLRDNQVWTASFHSRMVSTKADSGQPNVSPREAEGRDWSHRPVTSSPHCPPYSHPSLHDHNDTIY